MGRHPNTVPPGDSWGGIANEQTKYNYRLKVRSHGTPPSMVGLCTAIGNTGLELTATQYRYFDAVRALEGTARQRISRPRIHGPLADALFDSESLEEDPSCRPVDYRSQPIFCSVTG